MPELLTLKQASQVLHCHPNTLRLWDNSGVLKAVRFGKRGDRRYKKEDVLRLIKNPSHDLIVHQEDNELTESEQTHYFDFEEQLRIESRETESLLELLYKASLHFLSVKSEQEAYMAIFQEAKTILGVDFGSVFLSENDILVRKFTTMPHSFLNEPRQNGYSYTTYKTGKITVIPKLTIWRIHPNLKEKNICQIVFIPLAHQMEKLGVLNFLFVNEMKCSEKKLNILKLFGSMVSIKIQSLKFASEAEDAIKKRDLFMSMAAHELKSPLTAASAYTQLIQKQISTNAPIQTTWVQSLNKEVNRSITLIDDLLKVSKIKSGKIIYRKKIQPVMDIVHEALAECRFNHPSAILHVTNKIKGELVYVNADSEKLIQALINILNNSIKFSPPRSPVYIVLTKKNNFFHIAIKDKGKGINKSDIPNVFKEFYRGGTNTKGMGLGLFITKTIIDNHGGEIIIDSVLNKGTTVKISIPLCPI